LQASASGPGRSSFKFDSDFANRIYA